MREHSRTPIERTRDKYGLTNVGILRHRTVLLVLLTLMGIFSSFLLYIAVRRSEQARARIDFENAAKARISLLRDRVKDNLHVLDWVACFHASSQKVERLEFREFTRQYLRKHHEILSLQWIPLVRDADRAAYEAAARKEGFADFQFTEGQNQ
ncbi:MAG: CHASE domain-containing protein, partial [Planctomycetota bacterium]|nr:CHASE domain-containing protein [Planctomycetota bacterium]